MGEREQLEQAIQKLAAAIDTLETQRSVLGDAAVDAMITTARKELAAMEKDLTSLEASSGLTAERKLVTMMFALVSGFTFLAETTDPETVRDLVNSCLERLVPIIEQYEGTVDKFIGGEIMALFGAPIAHENDPERALRTALEMTAALAAFNEDKGTDLRIRLGINTGLVIAGGIGTPGRQEYSVMGDAVNIASRLVDAAEEGEILIGQDTYNLTAPLFEFESLEPLQVKGKVDPVPAYRLLAPKAVPGRLRGIAGLESPLVGREAESHALQAAIKQLLLHWGARQAGGPPPPSQEASGIVTLAGEAGLGKSRLVAEARAWAEAWHADLPEPTSPPLWVEGRCLSYGTTIAYLLWLDVLRGVLGVTPETSPTAVRDKLREKVQTLCPEHFPEVYPYLGRLMSLPLEAGTTDRLQNLEGETLKAATFQAMTILLEAAAQKQPLILVCEDLHWGDPTSIELLEDLLALTDRVAVLFICIFRPERQHPCWRIRETTIGLYRIRHTDLWLTPLSDADSAELVGNLLRLEDLPHTFKERILGHTEGNPLYVEEVIRSLIDDGAIVQDEATGRWVATRDIAEITIPGTLHGVLVARIDRLQEEAKRVLQLAAVIGRIFLYRVLAAIAQEKRRLDQHLLTLQREEMIRERARMPELEYIFKHQLTQEAAYNGLLIRERRLYHRQTAEALEQLFPHRIEEQVGLLAYHWERAEEPEKAITYLLRAGDQARIAYSHQEAIDAYQRALVFLKKQRDYERTARTLMKLGLTYHAAFNFRQARQAYEEGFVLWQRAGEVPLAAPLPPAPHALRMSRTNPPTLDPTLAGDNASTGVISQLFSGLAEQTPEMEAVPDVAQRWTVSEGGRKYVFLLRNDVSWSDGLQVTARDFEYAWKRVLDPATGSSIASMLYDVKGARAFHDGEGSREDVGVRALDDITLEVELEEPTAYFPYLLTTSATYPVPQHVVEKHAEAWSDVGNIVTNGPFRLEAWQPGQAGVLSRNPAYHGRFKGNLQRVQLVFTQDSSALLEMYEGNALDIVWSLWSFPMAEWNRFLQRYPAEYVSLPELATHHIRFNVTRPPFDDQRVRHAFALATDRETLADVVTKGHVFPATGGFVPPGIPGHSAGIALPYDPERARQLLAEAGYPNGRGFPTVDALAPGGREAWCEYLQTHWLENLGVDIPWEIVQWPTFVKRIHDAPPSVIINGWVADYPDPDNFLRVWLQQHQIGWQSEPYDRLVEAARRVMHQEQRMEMYRQADRILIEEAPILPLIYRRWHMMVKPWVKKIPTWIVQWKDIILESRS